MKDGRKEKGRNKRGKTRTVQLGSWSCEYFTWSTDPTILMGDTLFTLVVAKGNQVNLGIKINSGKFCFVAIRNRFTLKQVYQHTVQFSSVAQSCPTLCNPMNRSTPGLPVHHQLLEFSQSHVHQVGDAIQPSHPLSSPSPPALNLSQHQGLFKWVSPSHQVAKVLEFQLQHQSFQWTPRADLL